MPEINAIDETRETFRASTRQVAESCNCCGRYGCWRNAETGLIVTIVCVLVKDMMVTRATTRCVTVALVFALTAMPGRSA